MAHFAQLDENNVVTQVIVVHNNELVDGNGVEHEWRGIAFCQSLYGANTRWVQTSYNGNIRGQYAGIGCTYDPDKDVFVAPPRALPSELAAIKKFNENRIGDIPNNNSPESP